MITKDTVNQVKDIVDCVDLATNRYGLRTKMVGGRLSILCPAHNDKNFGSCIVTKHGIKCFACGFDADCVTMEERYNSCDFCTAVENLAALYGLAVSKYANQQGPRLTLNREWLSCLGILNADPLQTKYETDRNGFFAFLEEARRYTLERCNEALKAECDPGLKAALNKRRAELDEFYFFLEKSKKNNKPTTPLVIVAAKERKDK